ncbi:hypothetical protein BKA62DRAFT_623825 [Auriculariales sp. MPI-PUGE-AT-0066]|nr:hypothetical protein BKA62DRAFT_623825 [Auriculariales sp. MPI-PUGE-AT-0066]
MLLEIEGPNRFASTAEAPSIRTRLADERDLLDAIGKACERAEQECTLAQERLDAIKWQYEEAKHLQDSAVRHKNEKQKQYSAQQDAVNLQAGFFHPIRRLTPDVLSRIFTFAVADAVQAANVVAVRQRQPFRLAAVCSTWRLVAVRTPRAWAGLEVLLEKPLSMKEQLCMVDMLACMLTRSTSAPVVINIVVLNSFYGSVNDPAPRADLDAIVCALIPALKRCVSLVVYHSRRVDNELFKLLQEPTPVLRRIKVVEQEDLEAPGQDRQVKLPFVPLLADVQVWGQSVYWEFPAAQSAVLVRVLCSAGASGLRDISTKSPLLRNLRIRDPIINPSQAQVQSASLECLNELSLHVSDGELDTEGLHRVLDAVHLKKLATYGTYSSSLSRMRYINLVAGTCPRLSSVRCSHLSVDAVQLLADSLNSLAALNTLMIHNTNFSNLAMAAIMCALSPTEEGGTWPCRKLRQLSLVDCSFDVSCLADADRIVTFATARLEAARRSTRKQPGPALLMYFVLGGWDASARPIQQQIDSLIKGAYDRKAAVAQIGEEQSVSCESVYLICERGF